ncbi:MAG: hypothetical protein M0Z92_03760 [Actinomycetota bacterium]|nr:hypothetical protein [Actinomycetota bacterium]
MEMPEPFMERLFEAAAPPLLTQARVVALARGSQQWVRDLNRWANGSVVEMSLSVTLSVAELAEALAGSAEPTLVVLDAENSEAVAAVRRLHGAPVRILGVATLPLNREPEGLDALVRFPFSPEAIAQQLDALPMPSRPEGGGRLEEPHGPHPSHNPDTRGMVSGITGARGAGSSTLAMATAQVLAGGGSVVLADMGAESSLAMYHDLDPASPSLGDLARAAGRGALSAKQLHGCCVPALSRGYTLLAGARRPEETGPLVPAAVAGVVWGLSQNFDHVLIDLDSAWIGADGAPSAAETALGLCDKIAVVADASLHGVHGSLRILERLLDSGLAPERIALCMNRTPRAPLGRRSSAQREIAEFAAEAVRVRHPGHRPPRIFSVQEQRGVEGAHEEVGRLPDAIGQELASWLLEGKGDAPAVTSEMRSDRGGRRRRRGAPW